ncbi:hypothetical protein [Actibacterium sp. 188UL27-1]|uniref:hypothetical protein n=1 Tax=Actibacterium sp. 188UL27-1 TaxID=2786961 RepID=UPI00195AC6BF|nr:hypothetical protein [Actibacterium sp. 188UL27-1]MBM7066338.1 hypothetical protein [Actibacterium sp. 188UL27-1]
MVFAIAPILLALASVAVLMSIVLRAVILENAAPLILGDVPIWLRQLLILLIQGIAVCIVVVPPIQIIADRKSGRTAPVNSYVRELPVILIPMLVLWCAFVLPDVFLKLLMAFMPQSPAFVSAVALLRFAVNVVIVILLFVVSPVIALDSGRLRSIARGIGLIRGYLWPIIALCAANWTFSIVVVAAFLFPMGFNTPFWLTMFVGYLLFSIHAVLSTLTYLRLQNIRATGETDVVKVFS